MVLLNSIINDDCFNVLKLIDDNRVDLIITDPPYIISKKSNFVKHSDNIKFNKISIDFGDWDKEEIDLDILFKHYKRVLRKGGTLVIFYDIWKSNNIKKAAEDNGFKQPRVCQWVKNNAVPINSKTNYLSNAIEYFFTFVKGGNPTFNSKYDKGIYNYPICHGKERTSHPTQKPLSLIKDIITKHSNVNDVVLDTFGGSGTTAVACIETNRNYILVENDEKYYNISINRINI
jgi:DNA modification methylase